MNLRQAFASIGLVAGTAFAFVSAPAQAAQLTAADLGLPTLSTAAVGTGLNSPKAAFPYHTNTFTPSQELNVRFSVLLPTGLGSRGMGMSNFGYYTVENGVSTFKSIFTETKAYDPGSGAKTNDWLGSCGKAITGTCEVTVSFKAGQTYQLGLLAKGISTYGVASLDEFTFDTSSDQFYNNGTVAGHPNPFTTVKEEGALFIGMEDGEYKKSGNSYYYDYQDWVVKAQVPEPATVIGLGVVAGGLLAARRRKVGQSA